MYHGPPACRERSPRKRTKRNLRFSSLQQDSRFSRNKDQHISTDRVRKHPVGMPILKNPIVWQAPILQSNFSPSSQSNEVSASQTCLSEGAPDVNIDHSSQQAIQQTLGRNYGSGNEISYLSVYLPHELDFANSLAPQFPTFFQPGETPFQNSLIPQQSTSFACDIPWQTSLLPPENALQIHNYTTYSSDVLQP